MINVNIVSPIIEKKGLQEQTARFIYCNHRKTIDEIYDSMLEKARNGLCCLCITRDLEENVDPLLTFFRLKEFDVKHEIVGNYRIISIYW